MAGVPLAARELNFGNVGAGGAPALEPLQPEHQGLFDAVTTFQDKHTASLTNLSGSGTTSGTINVTAAVAAGLDCVAKAFSFGSVDGRKNAGALHKMLVSLTHSGKGSFFEHVGVNKIIQFANGLVARERAPAGKLRTRRGQILERMVREISRSVGRAYKELQSLPPQERLLDPQIEVKLPDGETEEYLQHLERQEQAASSQAGIPKTDIRFRSPRKHLLSDMRSSHGDAFLNAVALGSAALVGLPAQAQAVNVGWRGLVGKRRSWGGLRDLERTAGQEEDAPAPPEDGQESQDECPLTSDMFNATPSHARAGSNRGGYISKQAKHRKLTRKHFAGWKDHNFPKNSPTAFAAASLEGSVKQRATDTLR